MLNIEETDFNRTLKEGRRGGETEARRPPDAEAQTDGCSPKRLKVQVGAVVLPCPILIPVKAQAIAAEPGSAEESACREKKDQQARTQSFHTLPHELHQEIVEEVIDLPMRFCFFPVDDSAVVDDEGHVLERFFSDRFIIEEEADLP